MNQRPPIASVMNQPVQIFLGLMVFLWVLTAAIETEVIGLIGNAVELRCRYPGKEEFISDDFRVIWQEQGKACFIDAYRPDQNMTVYRAKNQCEDYKERTKFNEQLEQGDFTLQLLQISPKDEFTYDCMVQKKNKHGAFEVYYKESKTLKVAANYSKPVLTGPVHSGEEMTFTCNSSHGYPQQKVYWINQTDSSLLNATEQFTRETDGMYSVFSTLTVKTASDIKLGCIIENERLHQNLTTTIDISSRTTDSPQMDFNQQNGKATLLGSVTAVIIVILVILLIILYTWWRRKKPSLQNTYSGICKNEAAANHSAPVEIENNELRLLE
ncbi:ICOS ligand isoform X2 [Rhineura floridana]|nr:ICOS ligand isoform X2 [Rhineura floridana]XP_061483495.1 ICOS ligand isoform X2 [Rhineura floridana]